MATTASDVVLKLPEAPAASPAQLTQSAPAEIPRGARKKIPRGARGSVANAVAAIRGSIVVPKLASIRGLRARGRRDSVQDDVIAPRKSDERLRMAREAQLVEFDVPEDLHWAAASLCLDSDASFCRKALVLCYSLAVCLLSLLVLLGLIETLGSFGSYCISGGDCGRGLFCTASRVVDFEEGTRWRLSDSGLCPPCPRNSFSPNSDEARSYRAMLDALCPFDGTETTVNRSLAEQLMEFEVRAGAGSILENGWSLGLTRPPRWAWAPLNATFETRYADAVELCDACSYKGHWPYESSVPIYHLARIGLHSWVALALVAIALAIGVTDEVISISTILLYVHSRRHDVGVRDVTTGAVKTCALWFTYAEAVLWLQTLRFLLLATLVASTPMLIMWEASDSISIILNGCALIFLLEIDNHILVHILTKREVRTAGQPLLCTTRQRETVNSTKLRCMFVTMFFTLAFPFIVRSWFIARYAVIIMVTLFVIITGWINEGLLKNESGGGGGRWLRMIFRWAMMPVIFFILVSFADQGRQMSQLMFGADS